MGWPRWWRRCWGVMRSRGRCSLDVSTYLDCPCPNRLRPRTRSGALQRPSGRFETILRYGACGTVLVGASTKPGNVDAARRRAHGIRLWRPARRRRGPCGACDERARHRGRFRRCIDRKSPADAIDSCGHPRVAQAQVDLFITASARIRGAKPITCLRESPTQASDSNKYRGAHEPCRSSTAPQSCPAQVYERRPAPGLRSGLSRSLRGLFLQHSGSGLWQFRLRGQCQ